MDKVIDFVTLSLGTVFLIDDVAVRFFAFLGSSDVHLHFSAFLLIWL
jgi:hypothetical protein